MGSAVATRSLREGYQSLTWVGSNKRLCGERFRLRVGLEWTPGKGRQPLKRKQPSFPKNDPEFVGDQAPDLTCRMLDPLEARSPPCPLDPPGSLSSHHTQLWSHCGVISFPPTCIFPPISQHFDERPLISCQLADDWFESTVKQLVPFHTSVRLAKFFWGVEPRSTMITWDKIVTPDITLETRIAPHQTTTNPQNTSGGADIRRPTRL